MERDILKQVKAEINEARQRSEDLARDRWESKPMKVAAAMRLVATLERAIEQARELQRYYEGT